MSKLKEKLMLSEKGYSDLKKAITACTITNIVLPTLLGTAETVHRRGNFMGRTVEAAGTGGGCGYSGIPGCKK